MSFKYVAAIAVGAGVLLLANYLPAAQPVVRLTNGIVQPKFLKIGGMGGYAPRDNWAGETGSGELPPVKE